MIPGEVTLKTAPLVDTRVARLNRTPDGQLRIALVDTATGLEFGSFVLVERTVEAVRRATEAVRVVRDKLAQAATRSDEPADPTENKELYAYLHRVYDCQGRRQQIKARAAQNCAEGHYDRAAVLRDVETTLVAPCAQSLRAQATLTGRNPPTHNAATLAAVAESFVRRIELELFEDERRKCAPAPVLAQAVAAPPTSRSPKARKQVQTVEGTPVSSVRLFWPDGRMRPMPGDRVWMTVPGLYGAGAVWGEAVKHGTSVRIAAQGKKHPASERWNVEGDPVIDAQRSAATAQKQTAQAEKQRIMREAVDAVNAHARSRDMVLVSGIGELSVGDKLYRIYSEGAFGDGDPRKTHETQIVVRGFEPGGEEFFYQNENGTEIPSRTGAWWRKARRAVSEGELAGLRQATDSQVIQASQQDTPGYAEAAREELARRVAAERSKVSGLANDWLRSAWQKAYKSTEPNAWSHLRALEEEGASRGAQNPHDLPNPQRVTKVEAERNQLIEAISRTLEEAEATLQGARAFTAERVTFDELLPRGSHTSPYASREDLLQFMQSAQEALAYARSLPRMETAARPAVEATHHEAPRGLSSGVSIEHLFSINMKRWEQANRNIATLQRQRSFRSNKDRQAHATALGRAQEAVAVAQVSNELLSDNKIPEGEREERFKALWMNVPASAYSETVKQ